MVSQLEEEYQGTVSSIKMMSFPRPAIIVKDEAKALIDDINSLKV